MAKPKIVETLEAAVEAVEEKIEKEIPVVELVIRSNYTALLSKARLLTEEGAQVFRVNVRQPFKAAVDRFHSVDIPAGEQFMEKALIDIVKQFGVDVLSKVQ
jgi:hypothetical protein